MKAVGENFTLTQFLNLILPNEERVVYISDLNENFQTLDKVVNGKLEKDGYDGTAKNLYDELLKRALIGHTHTKKEISDFIHNHDDRYYTEAEIDKMLQDLLNHITIRELELLLGKYYKGEYQPNISYCDGDIYYKKNSTVLSLSIPDMATTTIAFIIPDSSDIVLVKELTSEYKGEGSNPILNKNSELEEIKKFFKLYGGAEKEYNINDNHDHKVMGIAIEAELKNIKDIKNDSLEKENTEMPIHVLNTQAKPNLQKFNY